MVLASASPRRAQLLRQVGLSFEIWAGAPEEETRGVLPAGPDAGGPGWTLEAVRARARETALGKAQPVAAAQPDAVVIAADTVVVIDGVVLGKPRTPADAEEMLLRLAGRTQPRDQPGAHAVRGSECREGGDDRNANSRDEDHGSTCKSTTTSSTTALDKGAVLSAPDTEMLNLTVKSLESAVSP